MENEILKLIHEYKNPQVAMRIAWIIVQTYQAFQEQSVKSGETPLDIVLALIEAH